MVRILGNKNGFSLVEILVATIVLSITALAFVSTIKFVSKMGRKAMTSDVAYSIARQRLALMQDGEILIRHSFRDTVERDGVLYYIFDEVGTVDSLLPLKLTITVTGENSDVKPVSLTGYLNRDICPDSGITVAPDSISISNQTIAEGAPANTLVGQFTIYDRDSNDLHMYLYDDTSADNELFRVDKGKLYTSVVATKGLKTVSLTVSDCADKGAAFQIQVNVTAYDSVPSIGDQFFELSEGAPTGQAVGMIRATPLNISYKILSQSPASPFSLGSDGTLYVGASGALDYEVNPLFILKVEVTNMQWHDTGIITVAMIDENEVPDSMTYIGLDIIDLNTPADSQIGYFIVHDPDKGDTAHKITMAVSSSAFAYFKLDMSTSRKLLVSSNSLKSGTYAGMFTAVDAGGLSISDTLLFTIKDSVNPQSGCGIYHEYESGYTYTGGNEVYFNNYIYKAMYWTTNEPYVGSAEWLFTGACDGYATCSDFQEYKNGNDYNKPDLVYYKGKVYTTNTWIKNKKPPEDPWVEVSPCR